MATFFTVYLVGIIFVALQGIAAEEDGYFTKVQLRRQGLRNASAFVEHGGMLADLIIVSPVCAYIIAKHSLPYRSLLSLVLGVLCVVVWMKFATIYARRGLNHPEAHAHNGHTTIAGKMRLIFAAVATWVIALNFCMVYTSRVETIIISCALTFFFPLDGARLRRDTRIGDLFDAQASLCIVLLWIVTGIKLML